MADFAMNTAFKSWRKKSHFFCYVLEHSKKLQGSFSPLHKITVQCATLNSWKLSPMFVWLRDYFFLTISESFKPIPIGLNDASQQLLIV